MASLLQKYRTPTLTDEQVLKGAKPREKYRGEVVTLRANWLNPDNKYESSFIALGLVNDYTRMSKFFEDELLWLNANVEMSEREVNTRKKEFYEKYQGLQDTLGQNAKRKITSVKEEDQQKAILYFPFTQYKDDLGKVIEKKEKEKEEEEEKKNEEVIETTPQDNTFKAGRDVLKYLLPITLILIGLRVASFAANEILWKPLPFRIISFIYTFIFGFIWGPYYLFRSIARYFYPEMELPRYESFLPLFEYDQNQPRTMKERFFGFPNSSELCDWATRNREQEIKSRQDASISTKFFEKLVEERNIDA